LGNSPTFQPTRFGQPTRSKAAFVDTPPAASIAPVHYVGSVTVAAAGSGSSPRLSAQPKRSECRPFFSSFATPHMAGCACPLRLRRLRLLVASRVWCLRLDGSQPQPLVAPAVPALGKAETGRFPLVSLIYCPANPPSKQWFCEPLGIRIAADRPRTPSNPSLRSKNIPPVVRITFDLRSGGVIFFFQLDPF